MTWLLIVSVIYGWPKILNNKVPEINNPYIINCMQFYNNEISQHSTLSHLWHESSTICMHYPLTVTTPVIRLTVTVSIVVVINFIWQQSTTMDIGSISIVSCYNCSILFVLLLISYSACLRYAYIEKVQATLQSLVLSWASGKG